MLFLWSVELTKHVGTANQGTGGGIALLTGGSLQSSSGGISLKTADSGVSGVSGSISAASGSSSGGPSGKIAFTTGPAVDGTSGSIEFVVGKGDTFDGLGLYLNSRFHLGLTFFSSLGVIFHSLLVKQRLRLNKVGPSF